jgi:hypothetical protein
MGSKVMRFSGRMGGVAAGTVAAGGVEARSVRAEGRFGGVVIGVPARGAVGAVHGIGVVFRGVATGPAEGRGVVCSGPTPNVRAPAAGGGAGGSAAGRGTWAIAGRAADSKIKAQALSRRMESLASQTGMLRSSFIGAI